MISTRVVEETEMRWTLAEVADATLGRLAHDAGEVTARGVSIDTRTLRSGDLYVAITGERHDGHAFLTAAFAAGAVAAVVAQGRVRIGNGHPLVEVEDTLGALQALAARSRSRSSATVAAVTGSNGKTTTREMLAHVLEGEGPTLRPVGNRNNHIGVPLTLLELDDHHRHAVLELAMNHAGEIAMLSRLVRPDLALITNVGRAHVGHLGGVAAVRAAKLEIAEGLEPGGRLLVPASDDALVRDARASGVRVETFGPTGADHAVRSIEKTSGGRWRVVVGEHLTLTLPSPGRPLALAAMAAIGAARAMGISPEAAVERLRTWRALPGRLALRTAGGITIIDDAYNANPESVLAALETLSAMNPDGRRIAVLGDMLELGSLEAEAHREVVAALGGVDIAHLVGDAMGAAADAAPRSVALVHHRDRAALIDALAREVAQGDVVLVKGSRGMELDHVVRALLGEEPA